MSHSIQRYLDLHQLSIKVDKSSGLIAILAIDKLVNGSSIGGCRFQEYHSLEDAINDAIRLSKAMTMKTLAAGLDTGGAKSVIIKNSKINDQSNLLNRFAEFVNEFKGSYITALDMGLNSDHINILSKGTNYIVKGIKSDDNSPEEHDTSYCTALTVIKSIKSFLDYKNLPMNSERKFAVQGVGKVGAHIVEILKATGAHIKISDVNSSKLNVYNNASNIEIIDNNSIYSHEVDVFIPCGNGTLNTQTINDLKCKLICGAANNQLSDITLINLLKSKSICYIPDFIANSGGVISAYIQYTEKNNSQDNSKLKIDHLYDRVLKILEESNADNIKIMQNIKDNYLEYRA